MKEHFLDRLYGEYQAFRASVLGCPSARNFDRCYEIDAVSNFYEILVEKGRSAFRGYSGNSFAAQRILSNLYEVWLKKYDSSYSEMQQHVEEEIQKFVKKNERKMIRMESCIKENKAFES